MSLNKRLMSSAPPPFVASENFKVVTYTGNDGTQNIDVGFKPDLVWIKNRNNSSDSTHDHSLFDSQRGTYRVRANSDGAANDYASHYGGITDNGFQVKNGLALNDADGTYVAWCWKANGGTTSTNTDGANIDSTVQVNANAGFSIVKFTGTGNAAHTVGHGLGVTPDVILLKDTSNTRNWMMHISSAPAANQPFGGNLDLSSAFNTNAGTNGGFGTPTSSVITFTNGSGSINNMNANNAVIIAYCFKSIDGFSKIGAYVGNGNAIGPIVETGFEPAFLLGRKVSGDNWWLLDNKRNTSNPRNTGLFPNLTQEDLTGGYSVDFLSNGFQLKTTDGAMNANGSDYIYMAFAADPDTEAPTVASSFNIETYLGNATSNRAITGIGFKPNFVWVKNREAGSRDHMLFDSLRFSTTIHGLYANDPAQEFTATANDFNSFDDDGFTVGQDPYTNSNDDGIIAYTWKADDNEPTINTNGTGIDSITSVNDAAGFSIIRYTGTGNASHTVGHGLSSTPKLLLNKSRDNGQGWAVVHNNLSSGHNVGLHNSNAETNSMGGDGSITKGDVGATTFGFTAGSSGVDGANKSGNKYITYCFNDVAGYQKIASYTGNGGSKAITGLGFKPDFLIIKSTGSGSWMMYDSLRLTSIGDNAGTANARPYLIANNNGKENGATSTNVNLDSDGFSMNTSAGDLNTNNQTYLYWAIAKNVPTNTTLANSFKTVTYSGNGGTQSITGVGFKPDLVWIKQRSGTQDQMWYDNNRGAGHYISSNNTNTQGYANSTVTSFDSDGFSVGSSNSENQNSQTFVAWCWKAGNTWESNINGTQPSIVNVNNANGFSIVNWKTNGSSSQTVGHGLSSTPEIVFYKKLSGSQDWFVETNAIDGSYDYGYLNNTDAFTLNESGAWSTRATSTTITNFTSNNNYEYVAYCFHSVSGYSKIGSYEGNQTLNTDNVVNFGFEPGFVMIKNADASGSQWIVIDSVRTNGYAFYANTNGTESNYSTDILLSSQGLRFVSTNINVNRANETYIYMAFKAN